jgi:hypothetical protein
MTITVKNLGDGQLPNSNGDLYEVPASTSAIVKNITIHNTNTIAELFTITFLKASGTGRKVIYWSLPPNTSYIHNDVITMGAGDKIQGFTTTASKVDYLINGAEIS